MCEFHVSIVEVTDENTPAWASSCFRWFVSDPASGECLRDGDAYSWARAARQAGDAVAELNGIEIAVTDFERELLGTCGSQKVA